MTRGLLADGHVEQNAAIMAPSCVRDGMDENQQTLEKHGLADWKGPSLGDCYSLMAGLRSRRKIFYTSREPAL